MKMNNKAEVNAGRLVSLFLMIGITIIIFGALMPVVTQNIWTTGGFNGSAATLTRLMPVLLTAGLIVAIVVGVFVAVRLNE